MIIKEMWHQVKEKSRTYQFRDGQALTIDGPKELLVSKSGNHYIKTETGTQYIITGAWLYLSFEASEFSIPTTKEVKSNG